MSIGFHLFQEDIWQCPEIVFCFHNWRGCFWHLIGRSQECCKVSWMHGTHPIAKNYLVQKSVVLALRNPALETEKGETRKIQGEKPTVLRGVASRTFFYPSNKWAYISSCSLRLWNSEFPSCLLRKLEKFNCWGRVCLLLSNREHGIRVQEETQLFLKIFPSWQ